MKIAIAIQARSNSTRLPGKIYKEVDGVPMLDRVVSACLGVNYMMKANQYRVYILGPKGDKRLEKYTMKFDAAMYMEGDPEDLVTRYVETMRKVNPHAVIRITGDCPMVPTELIQDCIQSVMEADYASNTVIRTFPDGFDVQGCSMKALEWFDLNQEWDREHLFQSFDDNAVVRKAFEEDGLTWKNIVAKDTPILQKFSVDTEGDLERVETYAKRLANP